MDGGHMRGPVRRRGLKTLPVEMRQELVRARRERRWSQAELGKRLGLPQTHISAIEGGKVAPRYDTVLELARVLDHDLMLVPRALVPAVQALLRAPDATRGEAGERPLYA